MDHKELLLGLLAVQFNKTDAEIAALIEADGNIIDTALDALKGLDAERVSALKVGKEDLTKKFDEGYKKAQVEVLTKLEKDLKEKHSVQSDKQGVDLVDEIITVKSKNVKGDLTDDSVKKHPAYLELEKKKQEDVATVNSDWEKKFSDREVELKKSDINKKVAEKTTALIDTLNPILSADSARAANQKKDVINDVLKHGYDIVNGEIIPLNADGSRMEDGHGHPVKLEVLVKEAVTSRFDLKKAEDRQSPGNDGAAADGTKNPAADGKVEYKGEMPKNEAEYAAKIGDSSIPVAERLALKEAYTAQASK